MLYGCRIYCIIILSTVLKHNIATVEKEQSMLTKPKAFKGFPGFLTKILIKVCILAPRFHNERKSNKYEIDII